MVYYIWVIDDKLAVSPLPSLSDIPELAGVFDAVVILVEPHEVMGYIDYYIDKWGQHGVEVYYSPTPDFHPVELLELHRINRWIDNRIRRGCRVLIHCMGGVGRSGMVAASYLIYNGMSLEQAIKQVSERRPGAPGNIGQRRMLEDYYILLNMINRDELSKHLEAAGRYGFGRGIKHVSKTLQYIIELTDYLGINAGRELYISAIYHCLETHELSELRNNGLIDESVVELIKAFKMGDLEDNNVLLLSLGHSLDQYYDGRLVFIDYDSIGDKIYLTLLCDLDCQTIIDNNMIYFEELSRRINRKISVVYQSYLEYV
jgi:protein-tyrosine phosphatase